MTANGDLLARGQLITLADGSTRRLRLNNAQLLSIEDHFGTIADFLPELGKKMLRNLAWLFSIVFEVTEAEALKLIDARRMKEYLDVTADVLIEAMGVSEEAAVAAKAAAAGEAQSQAAETTSPGSSSSASPSSPATSIPPPSGIA
jgi:hypothetical protein